MNTNKPSRSVTLTAGALLLLLTSCGTSDTETPKAATKVTNEPTVITLHGSVKAGSYRNETADPPFDVTLPSDDWFAGEPSKTFNGFNLYPSDPNGGITVIRFTAVYDDKDLNPDPVPPDVAAWLHDRPQFQVTAPLHTQLDGRPAVRFDATVSHPDHSCDIGDGAKHRCAMLAPVPANEAFRFAGGERIRFWVLDLDGPVVVTMSHWAKDFDAFAVEAERVVESIRFLDG